MSVQTGIEVRVIAKGGKFIGDDVGGASVTIEDAQTGQLLATGNTSGGSGAANLMGIALNRTQTYPIGGASVFSATLSISEPVLLRITAWGPKGGLQSANTVTATQWMIPGIDITGGDGLLLELPGLMVQAMLPATHLNMTAANIKTVNFLANVTMMCGCPIAHGTPWDPSLFRVGVQIRQLGGSVRADIPLAYTGNTSQFAGTYTITAPGNYTGVIYATQPGNGNSGMARVSFFTQPA